MSNTTTLKRKVAKKTVAKKILVVEDEGDAVPIELFVFIESSKALLA